MSSTTASDKTKALLQILMGAAWLDGVIQPEERQYLHTMAQQYHLENDPDIKRLLSEAKPIQPSECVQWITNFLTDHCTNADYEELLEALSALIYSDGDVQVEEAKILMQVQALAPTVDPAAGLMQKFLKPIQTLYRNAIQSKG